MSRRSRGERSARVRIDGEATGTLWEEGQESCFRYDGDWLTKEDAEPVSLTLPLSDEIYRAEGLHPFFENLIPEGWLLELSTTKLKISKDDIFGILLATCADCVGAVEIIAIGDDDA